MTPATEAVVPVTDLAVLRGYGVFDYFLVKGGVPLFVEDYLERFYRSAWMMRLAPPMAPEALEAHIREVIAANHMEEGAIRLVLTGGPSSDGFTPEQPTLLVLAHDPAPVPRQYLEKGIRLLPVLYERDLPEAKSIHYAMGIRLREDLRATGSYEALYHNGRQVLETFRSNVFFVFPGPVLATPDAGLLAGITRMKVLEVAKGFLPVEVRPIALEELRYATECFITGSNKGLLPVVHIGDQPVGSGLPGPVWAELTKRWEEMVGEYILKP